MEFIELMKEIILDDECDWVFLRLSDGKVFDGYGREVKWCPIEDNDDNGFVWWPIDEGPFSECDEASMRKSIRSRTEKRKASVMKKR